jgi:hypothetical protein
MRALLPALLAAAVALPAAAGDLGVMPFSGQMAIEWMAREDDGSGGFTGRYTIRGGTDEDGGAETLLGGFSLRCEGTLTVADGALVHDRADCALGDRFGNRMRMMLAAGPGVWGWHTLAVSFSEGTGPYRRVRGSGAVIRSMHLAPENTTPWGFFAGDVAWRLD